MAKEVILVTGGSGFIAQHLIKELCTEQSDNIAEIRVADMKIFRKYLDFDTKNVPIKEFIVDCSSETELEEAVKGCTAVYNLCGRKFPMGIYQDKKLMRRDNVDTVKTLVSLMRRHNVTDLIHISDAFVCAGKYDCQAPTEIATLERPEGNFLLGPYCETKFDGEKIARESNGLPLANGGTLRTVILRPCYVYGEGEATLIPHAFSVCQQFGFIQRMGVKTGQFQSVYAGNVAVQMLLALKQLRQQPSDFAGEVFFATEGTHLHNYYDYIEPFIKHAGYGLSRWNIPLGLARIFLLISQLFFLFFYKLFGIKIPHNLPSYEMVRVGSMHYYHFSGVKSHLLMKFQPKYDRQKAMQNTIQWWGDNWSEYA